MDMININIDDPNLFSDQDRLYFRSELFQSLSPTAKIDTLRQRMLTKGPQLSQEQLDAQEVQRRERLAALWDERNASEQQRLEASREVLEKRNRQIRGY